MNQKYIDLLGKFYLSPTRIVMCGALILIPLSFLLVDSFSSNQSKILLSLNKAFQHGRPLESRISGFDYAPLETTQHNGVSNFDETSFIRAKSLALQEVSENPSSTAFHTLGKIYLTERRFDDAIKQFKEALKVSPNGSELHNDLGSAFLEKGKSNGNNLKLLANSIEEFEKAIELNSDLYEAYFNLALSLQIMKLPSQTDEALQEYVKKDVTSKWGHEAQDRLQKLRLSKITNKTIEDLRKEFSTAYKIADKKSAWRILSANREIVNGKLIAQQLIFLFTTAKWNNNDIKAKEYLKLLHYAGDLEHEKANDSYWKKIANFYSTASKETIHNIKRAHASLKTGYKLYGDGKYNQAADKFKSSKEILSQQGSIWEAKLSDYWIGSSFFYSNQINESTNLYIDLAAYAENNQFKWMASHAYSRLVYDAQVKNQKSKAINYAEKALVFAKSSNDLYNIRKISSQIAELYKQVGRYNKSLELLKESLKLSLLPNTSLNQKWLEYEAAADTFHAMKLYNTAIYFEKEALGLATRLNRNDYEHFSNVNLGMIYASKKKFNIASTFLEASLKTALKLTSKENINKGLAYSYLKLAHLKRLSKDFDGAVKTYAEALKFFDTSEFTLDRYEAHKGLLLAYFANKNDSGFEKELPVILGIFEKYRSEILEEKNRNSFFDQEQSIYDIAIEFEYNKGNFRKAFDYSEESRSRSLLNLMNKDGKVSNTSQRPEIKLSPFSAKPRKSQEIQSQLSKQVQVVQYAVIRDRILIWLLVKEDLRVFETQIPTNELQKEVTAYTNLISAYNKENTNRERALAIKLYKILISPIEKHLEPNKIICFIPDKFLSPLPFASLISPETKDYFIKKYKFLIASSTNTFLISTNNSKKIRK